MEGIIMDDLVVDDLEWTTTKGKTLQVKRKNPYGFLCFSFKEGGQLPDELIGSYTSFKEVEAAADKYMKKQPEVHRDPTLPRPELKTKPNAKKSQSQSL